MIIAGLFCLSNLQAMDWNAAFAVFKGNVTEKSMKHDDALDALEAANVSIDDNHAGDIVALYLANDLIVSKDKARLTPAKIDELKKALATYKADQAAAAAKASVAASTVKNAVAPEKAENPYVGLAEKAAQALKDALKAIPDGDKKKECIAAVKEIFGADNLVIQESPKVISKQAGQNLGRLSGKNASKRQKN